MKEKVQKWLVPGRVQEGGYWDDWILHSGPFHIVDIYYGSQKIFYLLWGVFTIWRKGFRKWKIYCNIFRKILYSIHILLNGSYWTVYTYACVDTIHTENSLVPSCEKLMTTTANLTGNHYMIHFQVKSLCMQIGLYAVRITKVVCILLPPCYGVIPILYPLMI